MAKYVCEMCGCENMRLENGICVCPACGYKTDSLWSWEAELANTNDDMLLYFKEKMDSDQLTSTEMKLLEKYFTSKRDGNESEALSAEEDLTMIYFES